MEFFNYFSNVFTFANMLILILGTIGGLLMGAAPINKPPTVPNIRIKIFAKVNTFEK